MCDKNEHRVYVLKLQNNKYYIGQTKNLNRRLQQHVNGDGSQWTQLYPPIRLIQTFTTNSSHNAIQCERIVTLKYMDKFGIMNVRGSDFCKPKFNYFDWCLAHHKLHLHLDCDLCANCMLCVACGRNNHKFDECYARWDVNGDAVDHDVCSTCGRDNHYASSCHADKTVWGQFFIKY